MKFRQDYKRPDGASHKDRVNQYWDESETTPELTCGEWPGIVCPNCGGEVISLSGRDVCQDCRFPIDTDPDLL